MNYFSISAATAFPPNPDFELSGTPDHCCLNNDLNDCDTRLLPGLTAVARCETLTLHLPPPLNSFLKACQGHLDA